MLQELWKPIFVVWTRWYYFPIQVMFCNLWMLHVSSLSKWHLKKIEILGVWPTIIKLLKKNLAKWTSKVLKSSMTIQNIKKGFSTTWIWPLCNKVVKKRYIPLNLHTNQHDVGAKFDGDDNIEEHNSNHEGTTHGYTWPIELQQCNNIGAVDHGMS